MRMVILIGVMVAVLVGCGESRGATPVPPISCQYRANGALPDPKCTPGATYSAVTQRTINKTICVKGWTNTVRPPVSTTESEKRKAIKQYGYAYGVSLSYYEYDHLIPLELGGAPNDLRNLFPEPHTVMNNGRAEGSFVKDGVENHLHSLVCKGEMTLAAARSIMRTDWRKALP